VTLQPTDIFLCQRGTTLYQVPASDLGQVRGVTGSGALQVVMANGIAHLSILSASANRIGTVQLADANALNAGTPGLVPDAQVMKAALAAVMIPSATPVLEGKVRLATEAEVIAGQSSAVVTASGLHAFIYGSMSGNWLPDAVMTPTETRRSIWDGPDDRLTATGDIDFRLNGGGWGQNDRAVRAGDEIEVRYAPARVQAAAHNGGLTGTMQNMSNSVHRTWNAVVDREPNPLSVPELQTAAPGQWITSDYTAPLSGVNVPVLAWGLPAVPAEVRIEEGPWTPLAMGVDAGLPINPGQRLRMRHRAAEGSAAVTVSSVNVGSGAHFITVEFRTRNTSQVAPVISGVLVSEANAADPNRFTGSTFYADVPMLQPGVPKEEVRIAGRVEGMVSGPIVTTAITAVGGGGSSAGTPSTQYRITGRIGNGNGLVSSQRLTTLQASLGTAINPANFRTSDMSSFANFGSLTSGGNDPGREDDRYYFFLLNGRAAKVTLARSGGDSSDANELYYWDGTTWKHDQDFDFSGSFAVASRNAATAFAVVVRNNDSAVMGAGGFRLQSPVDDSASGLLALTFTDATGLNLLRAGDAVEQDNAAVSTASLALNTGSLQNGLSTANALPSALISGAQSQRLTALPGFRSSNGRLRFTLTNCPIGTTLQFQACYDSSMGADGERDLALSGSGWTGAAARSIWGGDTSGINPSDAKYVFTLTTTAAIVVVDLQLDTSTRTISLFALTRGSGVRGPAGIVESVSVLDRKITLRDTVGTFTVGRTVHGPERALEQATRYLLINGQGQITGLSSTQQAPVAVPLNGERATLTFPATFPSGHPPDTDIPDGSHMVIRAVAENIHGANQKESGPFLPAGSAQTITAATAAIGFNGYDAAVATLEQSAITKLQGMGLTDAEIAAILGR